MKNFVKLVVVFALSCGFGYWANEQLTFRYLIEEYFLLQNLDPKNEKGAEAVRNQIQKLGDKILVSPFRAPTSCFQCFKIISEPIFFCSAEVYREKEAEAIRKLLWRTVPETIGWIPMEEAQQQAHKIRQDLADTEKRLADAQVEFDRDFASKKLSAKEQKLEKTRALYVKNQELLEKKKSILETMMKELDESSQSRIQVQMQELDQEIEDYKAEYAEFQAQNPTFFSNLQHRQRLEKELAEGEKTKIALAGDLAVLERTIANPSPTGQVADLEKVQLIPQEQRRKFEAQKRPSNTLWYAIVAFFILSNFLIRIRTIDLLSFDDATHTEAI